MEKTNIFTAAYWRAACGELKKLDRLVLAAVICALCVVMGGFYIPLTNSLQIHFTFFVVAVGCAVYGPVTGMLVAAAADLINYFLFLGGYPYFPGYMVSEMLTALIFGLFLYRQKITVFKLFCSKVLVNFPVNVVLGALWSRILYDKGYIFDLWQRLLKNALLLPLEVITLAAFFAMMIPFLSRMRLLPAHREAELRRLSFNASIFPVLGLSCLLAGGCSIYYGISAANGPLLYILGGALLAAAVALPIIGWELNKKPNI